MKTISATRYLIATGVALLVVVGWYLVNLLWVYHGQVKWNGGYCAFGNSDDDASRTEWWLLWPVFIEFILIAGMTVHALFQCCMTRHPSVGRHIRRFVGYLVVSLVIDFY